MAIEVQSSAIATFTDTSITITKPSGLEVGNLMIALTACENGNPAVAAGWTSVVESSGGSTPNTLIQYKIADSGDVAASDFTFTCDSNDIAGALLRVDGHAPTSLFSDSEADVVSNTIGGYDASLAGVDPITDGELVVVVGAAHTTTAPNSVSNPVINGTNPSWTEVLDDSILDGSFYSNAYVIYAIQTTETTITSFTATLTNTGSATDYAVCVATISPQRNVTGTFTHLTVSPNLVKPVAKSGVIGTHSHLTVSPNLVKPTASVVNDGSTNLSKTAEGTTTNLDKT